MKFEKLTDTKIRVLVSMQDMELNNLSVEHVLSNSADSEKLINTIIENAEKEIGFKPEDSQLLVEAIAPSSDQCIFTITKISDDDICCSQNGNCFVFKFDNFNDFINLCVFIKNFSFLSLKEISKDFSLIYYNNTYYLKFTQTNYSSIFTNYLKTIFEEFGKNVSNSCSIDGILSEYGKIVFSKNAILNCINSFCT